MRRVAAVKTGRSEAGGQVGERGGGFSRAGVGGARRERLNPGTTQMEWKCTKATRTGKGKGSSSRAHSAHGAGPPPRADTRRPQRSREASSRRKEDRGYAPCGRCWPGTQRPPARSVTDARWPSLTGPKVEVGPKVRDADRDQALTLPGQSLQGLNFGFLLGLYGQAIIRVGGLSGNTQRLEVESGPCGLIHKEVRGPAGGGAPQKTWDMEHPREESSGRC